MNDVGFGCRDRATGRRRRCRTGRPVVALESTLITHGFAHPMGVDAARRAEAAVRAGGAEPATVAVHGGRLVVGLSDDPSSSRSRSPSRRARRLERRWRLALAGGGWAGTTVSATMIAAALADVRVFATGGIGGVHRGGATSMDISADLDELAQTPVLVVCAGPKSVLDIDLTLEYLETRGVPVLGWQTTALAGFYARDSGRVLAGLRCGRGGCGARSVNSLVACGCRRACSSAIRYRRCRALAGRGRDSDRSGRCRLGGGRNSRAGGHALRPGARRRAHRRPVRHREPRAHREQRARGRVNRRRPGRARSLATRVARHAA